MLAYTLACTGARWYAAKAQSTAKSLRPWTLQYNDAKLLKTHDVEFCERQYQQQHSRHNNDNLINLIELLQ